MIIYFGVMKEFEYGKKESVIQNVHKDVGAIGFWFTSNIQSAKPYAIGTETVFEESKTDFWEDGEPKVIQMEKQILGFVYKVFIHEPNLKVYESDTGDSYDVFMKDRDKYCDYFGAKKKNLTWKDNAVLLNVEEANTNFRNTLIRKGFEGFIVKNCEVDGVSTDLYCLFTIDSVQITDIIPVEKNLHNRKDF